MKSYVMITLLHITRRIITYNFPSSSSLSVAPIEHRRTELTYIGWLAPICFYVFSATGEKSKWWLLKTVTEDILRIGGIMKRKKRGFERGNGVRSDQIFSWKYGKKRGDKYFKNCIISRLYIADSTINIKLGMNEIHNGYSIFNIRYDFHSY